MENGNELIPSLEHPSAVPKVSVNIASSPRELDAYSDAWDDLLLLQPFPLPMSSSAWVKSYAEHLVTYGQEIHCVFAHAGNRLIGVLPVAVNKGHEAETRTLTVPNGNHFRSCDMTLAPDCASVAARALIGVLPKLCSGWHKMHIEHIPEQTFTKIAIESLHSVSCGINDSGRGAYVNTAGKYEEYINSLSHNFARNLRRVRGKLQKDYSVEFQFLKARPDSFDLLDDFLTLEKSGWKGLEGTAIKASPELHQFYRALAERLAARGWLEYHRLVADGRVVACHIAVRYKRTVILMKIAYDEQLSPYAPGNTLMHEILRRSFEDPEIDEVNCLTDMEWNANWKMSHHKYLDLVLFPHSPFSFLAGYCPQVMRQQLRTIEPIMSGYRWFRKHMHQ
jgi:CelD/BcsL family acetyltransferase involved in cellulose biosynthesis